MSDNKPLYQTLFPENWELLPDVFKKHYGNRIGCGDNILATGTMDIWRSPLMVPISFMFRWLKTLVPITKANVATKVVFRTRTDDPCFWFDREFDLGNGNVVNFLSRMEPISENEVIEWTGSGIGWKCRYSYDQNGVRLQHVGYCFRFAGLDLSLPVEWLIGRPSAWEKAVDGANFRMEMKVTHRLFGTLYSYAGQFEISEISLEK